MAILLETGDVLLKEDGDFLLEESVAESILLLETGDNLLLETGDAILLEDGASEEPPELDTPVIDTASPSSDTTPTIDVDTPLGEEAGDIFNLQISDNGTFTGTPDDVESGEFDVALTPATFAEGTYYARARWERGEDAGEWSSTLAFTIGDGFAVLMETGGVLLLETGDQMLLE